jgi:hypothetical protein
MDQSRGGSRIVYPQLLATLTEVDLVSQFRLTPEERAWAGTVARREAKQKRHRADPAEIPEK